MQSRLAGLAGAVVAALDRRADADPEAAGELSEIAAVLRADYDGFGRDDAIGPDDVVGQLAGVLDLEPVEERLLVAAAAPELDATFAMAYAAMGVRSAGHLGIGAAMELCGVPTTTSRAFTPLLESAPLVSHGLVEVIGDGPWPWRTLRVPLRVTAHLAGAEHRAPQVADLVVRTLAWDGPQAERVAQALASGAAVVWVQGRRETAGAAAAVHALDLLGLPALVVDLRRAPSDEELADRLRAVALEAALAICGVVVLGGERLLPSATNGDLGRRAAAVLEHAVVPVVVVSTDPPGAGTLQVVPPVVEAPTLTSVDRGELWRAALDVAAAEAQPGVAVDPGPEALSQLATLRLPPEAMLAAARSAVVRAAADPDRTFGAVLRDAARSAGAAGGLAASAAHGSGRVGFDDLVLHGDVTEDLRRLVGWARHRDEVAARGTIAAQGGTRQGIAALFTGKPGTGKTLAAHVVASELDLELFQVELSTVIDKYIGETQKKLEAVFREAEQRNVLLFFDEADALFGSRSSVSDARDRYANQEIAYLLQRMDQFDGIVVLATNLRGNFDAAFSRRMNFIVHFLDPNEDVRQALWERSLSLAGPLDDDDPVDTRVLARTLDLAGGDIRNVVLAATYEAVAEGVPVGQRHVAAALRRELRKLGRHVG